MGEYRAFQAKESFAKRKVLLYRSPMLDHDSPDTVDVLTTKKATLDAYRSLPRILASRARSSAG